MSSIIIKSFSDASTTYDHHARLQQVCSNLLIRKLVKEYDTPPPLPSGEALEIGCGTGLLTKQLLSIGTRHQWTITDLSPGMLEQCKRSISSNVQYDILDGEQIDPSSRYSLIVSGLSVHWFQQFAASINKICQTLVPGGAFLFSFVESGSFPEWQQLCNELAIPYSGNRFPSKNELYQSIDQSHYSVDIRTEEIPMHYNSAKDFFSALKKTGCAVKNKTEKHAKNNLRHLIQTWDNRTNQNISITYRVAFGVIRCKK